MKLLGIDYGSKRIGLALSDDAGLMAFPHAVLKNDEQFLPQLIDLIAEAGITTIVIGHSLGRDGAANAIDGAVQELVTDLTLQTGVPVHLEPEQYTTQEAIRFQGRNDNTDASAAAIILNSFITRNQ